MTAIGTITIQPPYVGADPVVLPFARANFPDGWPVTVGQTVAEPINAMGVDWTRYRLLRDDGVPFRMVCFGDYPTFDDAVTAHGLAMTCRYGLATISITCAGVTYTFGGKSFYVLGIAAKPVSGEVVGTSLANTDPLAALETLLTLQVKGFTS